MARTCLTIILAAGEGTRMRSARPKVLHEVAGLSLLGHVIRAAADAGAGEAGGTQAVVVGRDGERVKHEALRHAEKAAIFEQTERLGTAHAVLAARPVLEAGHDDLLVLFGDTPLITAETLAALRARLAAGADLVVLGFRTPAPYGYGRLIEENGDLVAIREEKEASEAERAITFCNGGVMAFAGRHALPLLTAIGNDNAKGEYYLTDAVAIGRAKGLAIAAIEADESEIHGVNDRHELARIETLWQQRRRAKLMRAGVTMQAPETVFLSHDTTIGADTMIEPHVVFGPGVEIADNALIRSFSHLEGTTVAAAASVGPYARLRRGTRLAERSKVGNFCEVKNAEIGSGAKVNHLSYIGDARIGAAANIGAGTITCNYDGMNKHHTEIGANAFIGTDTALVAPVTIGAGAYIASGSVITEDVPADAMAVARGRQAVKPGYAVKIRERNAAFKQSRAANKAGSK